MNHCSSPFRVVVIFLPVEGAVETGTAGPRLQVCVFSHSLIFLEQNSFCLCVATDCSIHDYCAVLRRMSPLQVTGVLRGRCNVWLEWSHKCLVGLEITLWCPASTQHGHFCIMCCMAFRTAANDHKMVEIKICVVNADRAVGCVFVFVSRQRANTFAPLVILRNCTFCSCFLLTLFNFFYSTAVDVWSRSAPVGLMCWVMGGWRDRNRKREEETQTCLSLFCVCTIWTHLL